MNWLCLPTDFNYTTEQLGELTREGIADELYKRGMDILTAKEKRYGEKTMRELERICLRNVDSSGWSISTTWTSSSRAWVCAATASMTPWSSTASRALPCSMR